MLPEEVGCISKINESDPRWPYWHTTSSSSLEPPLKESIPVWANCCSQLSVASPIGESGSCGHFLAGSENRL